MPFGSNYTASLSGKKRTMKNLESLSNDFRIKNAVHDAAGHGLEKAKSVCYFSCKHQNRNSNMFLSKPSTLQAQYRTDSGPYKTRTLDMHYLDSTELDPVR